MTILESIRAMLAQVHEAEGLPAEVEMRLPRQAVAAMCREAARESGNVIHAGPLEPAPWLRTWTAWGAIFIRSLDDPAATSAERGR